MQKTYNKWVLSGWIVLAVVLLLVVVVAVGKANNLSDKVTTLSGNLATQAQENTRLSGELVASAATLNFVEAELVAANEAKRQLELQLQEQVETETNEVSVESYEIEDVEINEEVEKLLTDKQLSLFDGEIEFNDETYEAEEVFVLDGVKVSNNLEDAGAAVYLTMPENSLTYMMNFEDTLDMSEVSEDETLEFSFLGEEVEVVEWTEDTVTFLQGEEVSLSEGETVTANGRNVQLVMAGEGYAYIKVDGVGKKVYEGDTKDINGLDVEAKEVLESTSWRLGLVTLRVGEEVRVEAEDGEEYEDDSAWSWVVDGNSLGLRLSEGFTNIDEDEDFKALATNGELALPNGFLTVKFNGLGEEQMFDFRFDVDTKEEEEYLVVKGSFTFGMTDYTRIYINEEGIFDKDLELISEDSIEMDGTEFDLVLDEGTVSFSDVVLPLDLSSVTVDEEDISSEDEEYRTEYGVIISNPEDSTEDQRFSVSIPHEQLVASVSVHR
ncbi:MAG: hypothetical protein Q8O68_00595 [Candidatus Daviesbacteria bacterium]|nr:hypothetical protein [Candidatus Daviesbacteria bacterium]